MEQERETMAGAIPTFIKRMMYNLHVFLPAKIESYDIGTKRAKVTPLLKYVNHKGQEIDLGSIEDVPVGFMGGKSLVIDIEYQAGDNVLVGFTDYGIGGYKASDGASVPSPDDNAAHMLTNAVVVCGLQPDGVDLSAAPKIEILADGNIIFTNNDAAIRLNAGGKIGIAGVSEELISLLSEFLQTLSTAKIITGIGPQPFFPQSITDFLALKTRLDTLKE